MNENTPRILILSHSHPKMTKGGAEISAGSLFETLKAQLGEGVSFIGCSENAQIGRLGVSLTQPFGRQDFVYRPHQPFAWFNFANRDADFFADFKRVLESFAPDILHFHHYAVFGVEALRFCKKVRKNAIVVVTLHEFLAICNNLGQMVRKRTHSLCDKESYFDCTKCFPEFGARDFFLRKMYIQTHFRAVDMFIAPSAFLAERYVEWGVERERILVLENPTRLNESELGAPSEESAEEMPKRVIRFGFFGQMSPLKGINVLLDAARLVGKYGEDGLIIEIHGTFETQPLDFQEEMKVALRTAPDIVRYCGPFENSQVHRLMARVDAVVMPSIWWENSPVVIEEALAAGRPVIVSNIGGMAEKVRDGIDGLHFEVGDSGSLARVLLKVVRDPDLLVRIGRTARKPPPPEMTAAAHLDLYKRLLSARMTGGVSD